MNLLEVAHLAKNYGATRAVRDVSFTLPAGFIMGLVGPNGAGKTTTIKAVLGLARRDSGTVNVLGESVVGDTRSFQSDVGVVMDAPFFLDEWTLAEIEKAVAPFYPDWDADAYAARLASFGLVAGARVRELSRGMKMKLQLAVALSHNAKLLVLDEPTSGLDPVVRDEMCELLLDFVTDESKGVLFSTHITTDLEKTADLITLVQAGTTVFTGAKDELLGRWSRIAGGLGDLDPDQRAQVIGYREHPTGFDGLIETTVTRDLPDSVIVEPASLDEIVVGLNRESLHHE